MMRYIRILKKNIYLLFFIAVSFVATTYAWFAYSGLKSTTALVDVKAWYIEFSKTGKSVSNNIVISLDNVEPGMESINEKVDIKNKGDSDAKLSYKIESIRILDKNYNIDDNKKLIDELSHDYPFHININMSNNTVKKNEEANFIVSLSWPLDSGDDTLDSKWGMDTYNFLKSEQEKQKKDPTYQVMPAIEIVLNLSAEQYVESMDATDLNYTFGTNILYDIKSNKKCSNVSSTCLSTTVIDMNNKVGDETVSLLPNLYGNYKEDTFYNYNNIFEEYKNDWSVNIRKLKVDDILKIISKDIINTTLISDYSPQVLGDLTYNNRIKDAIDKATNLNGYYKYNNDKFSFLTHHSCFYTSDSYNDNKGFAFTMIDNKSSKLYGENKNNNCFIIPVIVVNKNKI